MAILNSAAARRAGSVGLCAWMVLAAAMVIGALASGARAQFSIQTGGQRGQDSAPVTKAELERYSQILGLDADQTEAAQMLLEATLAEFEESERKGEEQRRELLDGVRAAREEGKPFDHTVLQSRMPAIAAAHQEVYDRLEKGFFDDLRSVLTPAQAERWPSLDRQRRRDRTLPDGRLAGEAVDLIRLLEKSGVPAEARSAVEPLVGQYELDLDRALVARNQAVETATSVLRRSVPEFGAGPGGPGGVQAAMNSEDFQQEREESQDARRAVRDVNNRYARQIASALPGEAGARFDQAYLAASFPRVLKDPFVVQALDAAAGFEDLTPEQKAQVESIRESWRRESDVVNARWIDAIKSGEETQGVDATLPAAQLERLAAARGETSPISEAQKARRDLEGRLMDRLKGVLSDAQRDRLPKPRQRGRSVQLPGGGEVTVGGDDEGSGDFVFMTSDSGAGGEVVVLRHQGGPPPTGEGVEPVVILHQVTTDENGEVVEEVHVETPSQPAAPKPQ